MHISTTLILFAAGILIGWALNGWTRVRVWPLIRGKVWPYAVLCRDLDQAAASYGHGQRIMKVAPNGTLQPMTQREVDQALARVIRQAHRA